MTRLLILIFVLNTLLPSVGFAAMLSSDTNNEISQKNQITSEIKAHCAEMTSHSACGDDFMSSDLCKAKCMTACSPIATHISTFSFDIPFIVHNNAPRLLCSRLYSRSISPELRPPLA